MPTSVMLLTSQVAPRRLICITHIHITTRWWASSMLRIAKVVSVWRERANRNWAAGVPRLTSPSIVKVSARQRWVVSLTAIITATWTRAAALTSQVQNNSAYTTKKFMCQLRSIRRSNRSTHRRWQPHRSRCSLNTSTECRCSSTITSLALTLWRCSQARWSRQTPCPKVSLKLPLFSEPQLLCSVYLNVPFDLRARSPPNSNLIAGKAYLKPDQGFKFKL